MSDLPDPVVLTEDELLAVFAGAQPEQLAMRNLIHTMFALVGSDITQASLKTALADLSGDVQIGNNNDAVITIQAPVTFGTGWNIVTGGHITMNGNKTLTISGTGSLDIGAGDIETNSIQVNADMGIVGDINSDGGIDIFGNVLLRGASITMSSLPTANPGAGRVWQDNAAARVTKIGS